MLEEHVRIRAAVQRFEAAARSAKRSDYIKFSQALTAHARLEEEVLYPAAVLVGRYVAREAPQR
jgi:hemerythrin superfamily protein